MFNFLKLSQSILPDEHDGHLGRPEKRLHFLQGRSSGEQLFLIQPWTDPSLLQPTGNLRHVLSIFRVVAEEDIGSLAWLREECIRILGGPKRRGSIRRGLAVRCVLEQCTLLLAWLTWDFNSWRLLPPKEVVQRSEEDSEPTGNEQGLCDHRGIPALFGPPVVLLGLRMQRYEGLFLEGFWPIYFRQHLEMLVDGLGQPVGERGAVVDLPVGHQDRES